MNVLTVNVGSSSVRISLFACQDHSDERLSTHHSSDLSIASKTEFPTEWIMPKSPPSAIVHRVVHAGQTLQSPCLIDAAVETEISRLTSLAPLHHPRILAWIKACRQAFPKAVHIAVFDTAFYRTLPKVAATYALPQSLCNTMGLQRFGFHGLAHQGMWEAWSHLSDTAPKQARVISLQLGSGCSITAIKDGTPRDTSMGFTPLEGLVMATRAGNLDPGLLLYLLREGPYSIAQVETLLNEQSGLLGLSGLSSDMRDLLASPDPDAIFAIELFCYRIRHYIGAYFAILEGLDALLIGGGIGENAAIIREQILQPLECFGILLDLKANRQPILRPTVISAPTSKVAVWVVPVQEDRLLLTQAKSLLLGPKGTHSLDG